MSTITTRQRARAQSQSSGPGIPETIPESPREPGGNPSGSPGLQDMPEQETPTAHAGVGRADEPSEGPADYGTNYYDRDDREDIRHGRDDHQALDRHGAAAARPTPHPRSAHSPFHHNEYMTNDDAIQAALQSASELEERLARIYRKVAEMEGHQNRDASPQAGPSTLRGKQIDPRNWGAAGVPDDDLDINNQRVRFNEIEEQQRNENTQRELHDRLERMKDLKAQYLAEKKRAEEQAQTLKAGANRQPSNLERRSTSPMSRDMEDLISRTMRGDSHGRYARNTTPRDNTQSGQQVQQPEVLQASNQVAPDSFLGRALHGQGSGGGGGGGGDDDDGPPPDEFNFGQAGDWNGANDGFGMGWGVPDDGGGGNHAFRPRYKPLSPTLPDKYHGDADPLKFYCYVTQCERFCREAGLPVQDRIPKCADSLAGKAYKFYTTSVSMDAHLWTMRQFFNELFNYCFPPDFRLKQRARLDGFKQNNMKVTEYAAELMVLFKTIGTSTPRECVEKLWNGLREELQRALWRENLDPIQSTWAEVVRVAMRHEVADRIVISSNSRSENNRDQQGYGGSTYRGNQSGSNRGGHNNGSYRDRGSSTNNNRGSGNSNGGHGGHGNPSDRGCNISRGRAGFWQHHGMTEKPNNSYRPRGDRGGESARCHKCGEIGHFANRCPKAHSVASQSKNGKPLGAKSFNVEVAMATENRFAALEGTTEQGAPAQASAYFMEIESAACGMEDFDFKRDSEGETIAEEESYDNDAETVNEPTPEDEVRNMTYKEMARNVYDPDGQGKVGDPLSTQIQFMLESMRPYPGDPSWESEVNDRFCVYSAGEFELCILDEVTGEQEILQVSRALRPDFLVGRWYAIRRTQEARVRTTPLPRWHKQMKVPWDCWKNNVAWRLSHGSDFSSYFISSKEEREEMERFEIRFDRDLDQYHVIDWQLNLHFPIGVDELMHPQRNIRVWYNRQIEKGIAAVFQMDWLMSNDYDIRKNPFIESVEH